MSHRMAPSRKMGDITDGNGDGVHYVPETRMIAANTRSRKQADSIANTSGSQPALLSKTEKLTTGKPENLQELLH